MNAHAAAPGARRAPSALSIARLPVLIGAIAACSFTSIGLLAWRSSADSTFAVEPDYYRKALDWDKAHAARAGSEALGWAVDVTAGPGPVATVRLADRLGAPITGAAVNAVAFPHRAAAHRAILRFDEVPGEPGAYASLVPVGAALPAGLWRLSITADLGPRHFLAERDLEVAAP